MALSLTTLKVNLNSLKIAVWIYDVENYCLAWANSSALMLWEADSLDELCSRNFKDETSDAVQESLLAYQKMFAEGKHVSMNWLFSPKGIEKQAFCILSEAILDDGRRAVLVEATPSEEIHSDYYRSVSTLLSSYSIAGDFIAGNPPFVDLLGSHLSHLSNIIQSSDVMKELRRSLSACGHYENDILLTTLEGEQWFRVIATESTNSSESKKILLHCYDIHQRKLSELSMAQEIYTDPLTGLLNRRGANRKFKELVNRKKNFVLFYIDLDGFKLINDSFGHSVGDYILRAVAKRLSNPIYGQDVACRFGGDEFLLIVDVDEMFMSAEKIADQLVSAISGTYYDRDNSPLSVSMSLGIASYPEDAQNSTDLVLCADAAMYSAKQHGKRRWVRYVKGMESSMRRQSLIAQRLYYAEKNGELALYYQPVWDLEKNEVVSFEALLRWNNAELGFVSASETVSVAEEVGLICEIENWVIERALSDLSVLRVQVASSATMAVNISAFHFIEPNLIDYLTSTLAKLDLVASDLVLELTESTLIDSLADDLDLTSRFVDAGIKISIDDFGTGYSSLAYLHRIPASTVKIDQSFIQRMDDNGEIVLHIHQLIKSLGKQTIAEGVETEAQRETLKKFGIDLHQGYLHGRPQPLEYYLNNKKV